MLVRWTLRVEAWVPKLVLSGARGETEERQRRDRGETVLFLPARWYKGRCGDAIQWENETCCHDRKRRPGVHMTGQFGCSAEDLLRGTHT
jgi:hypothetical protein